MKRLLLIIVTLLCMPAFTGFTQACQCREYGTPLCAHYWRSDAVFLGQVIDIKPLKNQWDNVYTYVLVSFRVEESFRGVSGTRVAVGGVTNTLCDPKYKKGKRYLVYATLDRGSKLLFSGMCTATTLAVDVDDEVKELRKLARREGEESISGRIKTRRYTGLPGITIEVTGNDKTFKTMTSGYGDFSISLPGPGSFKVRVTVPYATQLMDASDDHVHVRSTTTKFASTFEYDVTLEEGQCSYLELDLNGSDPREL